MEPWRYSSGDKGFISFDGFLSSDSLDKRTTYRWIADSEASSSFCSGSSVSGQMAAETQGLCKQFHESSLSDATSSRIHGAKTVASFSGNSCFLSLDGGSTSRLSSSIVASNGKDSSVLGLHLGGFSDSSSIRQKPTILGAASSSDSLIPPKKMRMGGDLQPSVCQVYGCNKDLSSSKEYHKKHKVCEAHSKTARVVVNGIEQRFCQQCSRFHLLAEFDDGKRSCRKRLAGHNERRRKPQVGLHPGRRNRLLQMYNTGTFSSLKNGAYHGNSMTPPSFTTPEAIERNKVEDWFRHAKLEPRARLNLSSSSSIAEEPFPSGLTFPLSPCNSLRMRGHVPSNIEEFSGLDFLLASQGLPEIAAGVSAHSLLPSESTSSGHVCHPSVAPGSNFHSLGPAKFLGITSQSSTDDLSCTLSQGGRLIDETMIYHGLHFGDGINHLYQRGRQPSRGKQGGDALYCPHIT